MVFYILIKMTLLKLTKHYTLDLCIALYIKVILIIKMQMYGIDGKTEGNEVLSCRIKSGRNIVSILES